MTANTKVDAVIAREYLRVSVDGSGRGRSVDEQHDDNERVAGELGWTLAEPYRDVDRSASRYARKVREGYDQLTSDLAAGTFGASVLLLWESSRGSRKVSEWVTLIELCEKQHVRIHVTTHNRTYDPANGRDRRSLLEDSVDSEYESSKISMRIKRASAATAAAGKPHGRVPYGYRRRYDDQTRQLIAQEPDPVQAPIIVELFERLREGHTLRGIAMDYAARGIVNKSGVPFSGEHLRSVALNVAYCGLRVHDPARVGNKLSATATTTTATWPPLVDRATFLAVQAILSAPERLNHRPGKARHLLSMIARCAVCGGRLAARTGRGRSPGDGEYQCHDKGCVRIDKASVDALAESVMLAWLGRPDVYESFAAGTDDDTALAAVRDEVAELRARADELADAVAAGALSVTLAARSEPKIRAQIRSAETREAELSTPSVLRGLITPGEDVAAQWDAAPISTRREIARLLLSPNYIGEMRIQRSPTRGNRCPVERRVEWQRENGQ